MISRKTAWEQAGELFGFAILTALALAVALLFAAIAVFIAIIQLDWFTSVVWITASLRLIGFVLGGLIAGCIMGGGQWLMLHENVTWAKEWVRATAAGWACASIAWWLQYEFLGGPHFEISQRDVPVGFLFVSLTGGLIIGAVQWAMLRRTLQISRFWILSSVVSWVVGMVVCLLLSLANFAQLGDFEALFGFGLVLGLGTRLAQLRLIRNTNEP